MYRPEDFHKAGVGLYPARAGIFVGKGDMVGRRLIHEGMGVSFDIEGSAFEQMEHDEFLVRPGQVICLWPRAWHAVTEHEGMPLQTIWLELIGSVVPEVAHLFGATRDSPIARPAQPEEVHKLFREIVAGFFSPDGRHPGHFLRRFYRIA